MVNNCPILIYTCRLVLQKDTSLLILSHLGMLWSNLEQVFLLTLINMGNSI